MNDRRMLKLLIENSMLYNRIATK